MINRRARNGEAEASRFLELGFNFGALCGLTTGLIVAGNVIATAMHTPDLSFGGVVLRAAMALGSVYGAYFVGLNAERALEIGDEPAPTSAQPKKFDTFKIKEMRRKANEDDACSLMELGMIMMDNEELERPSNKRIKSFKIR